MIDRIEKIGETGLAIINPKVFNDDRGYFYETYNMEEFNKTFNIAVNFIQDNESKSSTKVIRGLHYQAGEHAQAKLVRVIKGAVIDFVIDIRKSSPTFGKFFSVELSEENKKMFYVPRGFAHGFVSLMDNTIFSYKCDNLYNKDSERGISIFDKDLNIFDRLGINTDGLIISDKDKKHPDLKNAIDLFE